MQFTGVARQAGRKLWIFGAVLALMVIAGLGIAWFMGLESPKADPANSEQVVLGRVVYQTHCASCHGANLEGAPSWRIRLPSGRMPPPPHDDSGHTWHHTDEVLFYITKFGLKPPYAPADYESDMPAFGNVLSDEEIWAVLAFIKSKWSSEVLEVREEMLSGQK